MSKFESSGRLTKDATIDYLEELIKRERKVYNIEVIFLPGALNPAKLPNPETWIYDDPEGSDSKAIKNDCLKLVNDASKIFGNIYIRFEIIHE